jgi:hypothetical protein
MDYSSGRIQWSPEMADDVGKEDRFTETRVVHGWNHTTTYGVCAGDVTADELRQKYYHSYFGGRAASLRMRPDGKQDFSVVTHTD